MRIHGPEAGRRHTAVSSLATSLAVLFCLAFGPTSLVAQDGGVTFPFTGSTLQLQVQTGGSGGSAEVVDVEEEKVSVSELTGSGGVAVRLDDDVLSVENRSGLSADYLIAVPKGVNVSLTVDGRTVMAVAAAGGGRRLFWRWGGEPAVSAQASSSDVQAYDSDEFDAVPPLRNRFIVNAFSGGLVTDSVNLAYLNRVKAFKIILGGERFAVRGDRSVGFEYHEPSRWGVITPNVEDAEITLELPSDLRVFKLRIGDTVIWEFDNGRAEAYCEPVAEVLRRDGKLVWVFTPDAGRLTCPIQNRSRLG